MKKQLSYYVMIGAGALVCILGIILAVTSPESAGIFAVLAVIGALGAGGGVAFLLVNKKKMANAHEIEATYLRTYPNSPEHFTFGYFEVDGKETKIVIADEVFRGDRFVSGQKYKIALDPNEEKKGSYQAIKVERID